MRRSSFFEVGRSFLIGLTFAMVCSAQDKELKELADSLASQIKSRGKGPVAITSFTNASYCSAFSSFLVDRLSILIARGNVEFDVVARDRVEEVFKEINLALGKNYDASTFAKIGKQLGTRSLIRGSYTVQSAGANVSIAAQILDVETGRIIGGEFAELRYTGDIKAMLDPLTCNGSEPPPQAPTTDSQGVRRINTVPLLKQTIKTVELELVSCRHRVDKLVCELRFKNLAEDREYMLMGNYDETSRAVDEHGSVYSAEHAQLGNQSGNQFAKTVLPSNISVLGMVTFPNVASDIHKLALLELIFTDTSNFAGKVKYQLHNVPIE